MDQEFAKWLASLGIGGILAAIFYYQSRKDMKENSEARITDAKMYQSSLLSLHDAEKSRSDRLLDVLEGNTHSTTVNTEVLRSLHARLDKENVDNARRV